MSKAEKTRPETTIFTEWDPTEPTIIVRIDGKMLGTQEWQAWRDCFDKLPSPGAKGARTQTDRVCVIKFKEPPPLEFVNLCIAQFHQNMEFHGYPRNKDLWDFSQLLAHPEKYSDPEQAKAFRDMELGPKEETLSGKGNPPISDEVAQLIEGKDNLIIAVGRGDLDYRTAFAALIVGVEKLED